MNKRCAVASLALPVLAALTAPRANAQGFEGTITMREVTLEAEPLLDRLGGDRNRLFAMSVERLREQAQEADMEIVDYAVTYYMKGSMLRSRAPGND